MDIAKGAAGVCPVDFDHESEEHARNWEAEFRAMREQCPVAWTEQHGGYWVATRYKDIVKIAQDTATFGSFKTWDAATGTAKGGITIPPGLVPRGLPVESDRPEWDAYRGFINRKFAPKAAEARRADMRRYADMLLDRVIETGEMDLVRDFTGPLPAMSTMDLVGLPLDEWHLFAEPLHEITFTPKQSPDYPRVIATMGWVFQRCFEEFERYRREPLQDNLLSHFAHETIDGRAITRDELASYCINILAGGVDTTTALTTNTLIYLFQNPAEKQRLIDDISLLPIAREEFIRFFTPMHGAARHLTRDAEFEGAAMKEGQPVYMAWSSGNRDPEIFEQPDAIDMTRFPNRHIAFGAGPHRCIGSFMARVAFEEMVTQILRRIPDYALNLDAARLYPSIGTINGWIDMPATFTPGRKLSPPD